MFNQSRFLASQLLGGLALATLLAPGCGLRSQPPGPASERGAREVAAVTALWHARAGSMGWDSEFPLGPGDLVELVVPRMPELAKVDARLAADGSFALPLLGIVKAGGLTEPQLKAVLQQRLSSFMYQPEFSIFVREYRSRQVAVVGEVARPGLYPLTTRRETIRDLVNAAGGFKEEGTGRILFFPARGKVITPPVPIYSEFDVPTLPGEVEPIVLDLDGFARSATPAALALPVRPGDVIQVPEAGAVFVQGWVEKPGPVHMSRGLTVFAAVTAAGGTRFPAAPAAVHVLRSRPSGERTTLTVNLNRILGGVDTDLPVHAGDIVDVGTTPPRLMAHWMYETVTTIVKVGASIPLI